jgi:molybdopterin converting factor small subunit
MTETDTRAEDARIDDDARTAAPGEPASTGGPATADDAPVIAVRLFAGAAAEFGAAEASVRARTAAELVAALTTGASPEAARVIARSSLLVDGVACTDPARELTSGTRVDVLPPFAGG